MGEFKKEEEKKKGDIWIKKWIKNKLRMEEVKKKGKEI